MNASPTIQLSTYIRSHSSDANNAFRDRATSHQRWQRSVPSDGQEHRQQAPRSARLFSAALERSRLPQRWKSRATAAATSFRDRDRDRDTPDRQDMTLKRLGRVGVVEIASSMVREKGAQSTCVRARTAVALIRFCFFINSGAVASVLLTRRSFLVCLSAHLLSIGCWGFRECHEQEPTTCGDA